MDEERGWAADVVLGLAEPLLSSQEIQQALAQVQLTEGGMRAILSEHAEDLILSPASTGWTFLAPINWDQVFRWRTPRPWSAPGGLVVLGGIAAFLVIVANWEIALAFLAISWCLAGLGGIFISKRSSFREPLTPTAETSYEMRRRVLGPFLREELNRLLDEQDYAAELRVTSAPGLAELSEREQIVATDASVRLAQLSRAMPTGNLGVSGARGAGKTTLLRNFCDATLEWRDTSQGTGRSDLRMIVSAPVDYDAREFILHLFGRLCETVLANVRADVIISRPAEYGLRRRRWLVAIPGLTLSVAGAAVIGWDLLARARRLPHVTSLDLSFAAGAALLVAGISLLLAGAGAGPVAWRGRKNDQSVPDEARMWLTRLRYLQAFTTGYSGTLRLPAGAQLEATTTRQLTELQLALPDLVDRYRDFALRTALWYRSSWPGPAETAGRIVVGIDELDKIGSAEACERFINDIKAIFSIPHCLYLVSVSDDALAAFEQRAFVARTAFDNAFDEVVQAGYLDFEAASSLLRSRVAGLPRSLIALCHALSGGLPRDLIRATRSLIDLCAEGHRYIAGQCEAMVATETDTLKHACLTTLAARPDQLESTGLLPRLLDRSWPGRSGEDLLRALDQDLRCPETPRNFCAAIYFYATVTEVFGPGLTATIDALRARGETGPSAAHGGDDASIDRLAHARNSLSGNPDIAWALVTRFRAARGLLLPDRPWRPGAAP